MDQYIQFDEKTGRYLVAVYDARKLCYIAPITLAVANITGCHSISSRSIHTLAKDANCYTYKSKTNAIRRAKRLFN